MSTTALTFEQLKEIMANRVGEHGMPSRSSLPNLISALEHFVRERDLEMVEPIGSFLRMSFFRARESHLQSLQREKRSTAYIANRKTLLSRWHQLVLAFDRENAVRSGLETPLQKALNELVRSGIKMKRLARATGVPLATLKRWQKGATPRRSALLHLIRIERYLGMAQGALTTLVVTRPTRNLSIGATASIAYRKALSKLSADRYRLKASEALGSFRLEWAALVKFKTQAFASVQGLLGDGSGAKRRWRLLSGSVTQSKCEPWVDVIIGRYCPSAEINFQRVAQYIGWLQLESSRGGLGMSPAQAQTLAHLCDREKLSSFIQWRVERSGGSVNAGSSNLLRLVSTLCHPTHGFLVQTPDVGRKIGISDAAEWRNHCSVIREFAVTATRNLVSHERPSRDPFEAIGSLVALKNPLDAIADAARRMDGDRPITGGIKEAIWARDRLLLTLSVSNPLRARNLRELTYRADNSGQLRRDEHGGWRIVIAENCFKNFTGAAKDRPYDMPVQEGLWRQIDQYVRNYWPLLAKHGCDLVFMSSSGVGSWTGLNRRYESITRKYVHNCPGFGPHSARHLVATALLKASGNVSAAALVLHDRESTVRRHYAHLLADDGARWLDQYVGDAFRRM